MTLTLEQQKDVDERFKKCMEFLTANQMAPAASTMNLNIGKQLGIDNVFATQIVIQLIDTKYSDNKIEEAIIKEAK